MIPRRYSHNASKALTGKDLLSYSLSGTIASGSLGSCSPSGSKRSASSYHWFPIQSETKSIRERWQEIEEAL